MMMKYYAVAHLEITDPRWVSEYVQRVTPMVEAHGGRYLARTSKIEKWEGEGKVPQILLVVEWPSREAAEAFYRSEEYQPFLAKRRAGSRGDFFLLAGEDMTGASRAREG